MPGSLIRPPRSALVVRSGALGDVLLLRRAIATLKATGCRVHLLVPGAAGRALVGAGPSEAASCFASERADLATLWSRDADVPEVLRDALGAGALAYACSGDADLAANLARHAEHVIACAPAPPPGVHASEWLARPLEALGLEVARSVPSLEFSPAEKAAARPWRERLPDRFLALHPGSGTPRKNWPAERYAELARAVSPDVPFLVVEGPADAHAVGPLLRFPAAVPASHLPLRTLGALLADSGAFVGNDSGITHLAAAAGASTLALFGSTDPAQWGPVGAAVRTLRAKPLASLTVAEVAAAARAASR